jgi:hypothetical protein
LERRGAPLVGRFQSCFARLDGAQHEQGSANEIVGRLLRTHVADDGLGLVESTLVQSL